MVSNCLGSTGKEGLALVTVSAYKSVSPLRTGSGRGVCQNKREGSTGDDQSPGSHPQTCLQGAVGWAQPGCFPPCSLLLSNALLGPPSPPSMSHACVHKHFYY